MAQWSEYWRIVAPAKPKTEYVTSETAMTYNNYTWYSQVLKGAGDRNTKYVTYDQMDADIDISRALDTIAEEMSTFSMSTDEPLDIKFNNDDDKEVDEQIVVTLRAALRHWAHIQAFDSGRMFNISRSMVKYGDCFFRKISDNRRWKHVDQKDILGIEIGEDMHIVNYHIKTKGKGNEKFGVGMSIDVVPAAGVVHFSLSDMMGTQAPFGASTLEPIVKTFRQLKLLEDACVIYRISRAPERRVFYVDVGNMPAHKVKTYLESLKNDLRQKRLPVGQAAQGVNSATMDSSFSAEAVIEDFFMAQPANGRGSRVETLPGGTNLGEIDDLKYFREKMYKGLRIPSSYMSGADAGGAQYNNGKVGVAYIEELRFANFVKRLQYKVEKVLDHHFKAYLKSVNIKIHDGLFNIVLPDPQNFASYRQNALDAELVGVFNQIKDVEFMSRRFMMKRYLGWNEEDIQLNEILLKQELNTDETANIPTVQQLYDPKFIDEREAPKIVEPEPEAPPKEKKARKAKGGEDLAGALGGESEEGEDLAGGLAGGEETAPKGAEAEVDDSLKGLT